MPIPKPSSGEKEDEYMGRCMSFLKDEGKYEHKQSVAICMSTWRKKDETVVSRIDKILTETTVTGDVETNTSKGKIDVITTDCPDGFVYDKKKQRCVLKEGVVSGDVIGSQQTRVVGAKDKEIVTLFQKSPDTVTRFNKLLGGYMPVEVKDK